MRKLIAIVAAVVAVAVVACDPYISEPGGTPRVISAFGSIYDIATGSATMVAEGSTPTAAGAVTIDHFPSVCTPPTVTAGDPAAEGAVFFVKFNKLLDGYSIQTDESSCAPAAGWLTAPAVGGGTWYSCYSPGSPTPNEGASVVIFWSSAAAAGGWDASQAIPAASDAVTPYHFTGSVKDKGGTSAAIDITANVDPNPGTPGDPTFLDGAAGNVAVSWTAAGCETAGTTQYVLERAPDVSGAAGTYAAINPAGSTALTFADTGTSGTTYWYRVTARTSTAVDGGTSGEVSHLMP